MITCKCCNKPVSLSSEINIIGMFNERKLMITCPFCTTSMSLPVENPVSRVFVLLADLASAVSALTEYDEAKIALEIITDQCQEPLDIQFARCLAKRIQRNEEQFKRRAS
jgi:hypothetical protein